MLTILNDPFGATGRSSHPLDRGVTLQENIARHLHGGADCALTINGVLVDPLTDPRMDAAPGRDALVVVSRRPAGVDPVTLMWIAYIALAVYAYSAAQRVAPPDASQHDSPNNRLTGQSNIARAYQAVPDVYGYRRVWPDLIQQSYVAYVDNVKYVTEWLCVSRGLGTVSDVQFADTPLTYIDGARSEIYEPGPLSGPALVQFVELSWVTTLPGVLEPFRCEDVNGQELSDLLVPPVLQTISTLIPDGTATFQLSMADDASLAGLKALAPAGTTQVVFTYAWLHDAGDGGVYETVAYNETCTVNSVSVASGVATFTFTGTSLIAPDGTTSAAADDVPARFIFGAATTTAIGPFTLPASAERIDFSIVFLRGLKGTVNIAYEWWQIDGAGVEIGGTRETANHDFIADTFDQQFFTLTVTPTAGTGVYQIQFARTTADLANGADVAKLESVYAVRYFATKVLPPVTVLKVTTKATEQATGFRDRKFNLRWLRHVRTLADPQISASRNFARILAHVWEVARKDVADLDTTTLAAINTALGETSDLLRFDGTFDDADMSLGERMQRVADMARCTLWHNGTQWTVTRDEERGIHEIQLDYRNLAARGNSAIAYSAHLPESFDGVEVEYVDETTQASKAYINLQISAGTVAAGTSANPKKIKMPGCVTAFQALNRAHLEIRKLLFQRTSVSDTVLSDGGELGYGTLVKWVDPNDFAGDDGLQAGEVLTIAGTLITTSEVIDWLGETSGRMQFTGVDGRPLGTPIVVTPGAGGTVDLASVPGGLFVADGATIQCGSRYAFAVGLTDAELEAAGMYSVTLASPQGDGTYSIALTQYDARVYELFTAMPVGTAVESDAALAL